MRFRFVFLILPLTACSPSVLYTPHMMDVQQGNVVTEDMLGKVKPGMTKSQVRFALGTPLIADPFHTDRWDYVYRFRKSGELTEHSRLTVVFEGDKLKTVEGTALPPSDNVAGTKSTAPKAVPALALAPDQPHPANPPVLDLKQLESDLEAAPPTPPPAGEAAKPITEQVQAEQPKRSFGERFMRLFGFGKEDETQQAKFEEKHEAQPEPQQEEEPPTNTVMTADRSPPPKRSVGERFTRLIGFKEKEGDDPAPPVTTEVNTTIPKFNSLTFTKIMRQILGLDDDKDKNKESKADAEDIEPGETVTSSVAQGSAWQRFKRLIGVGGGEQETVSAPVSTEEQTTQAGNDAKPGTAKPESVKP